MTRDTDRRTGPRGDHEKEKQHLHQPATKGNTRLGGEQEDRSQYVVILGVTGKGERERERK